MFNCVPRPPPTRWKNLKHAGKTVDTRAFDERCGLGEQAMTINNNETSGVSRLNLDQTTASPRAAEATSAPSASAQPSGSGASPVSDSISLSSSPNLVQQALSAGASARSARVQELKALVQNNQYQPSAQEVSSALISAHLAGE
jgi:flagellar biosynthesis anti-sigma factor FlgM